MGFLPIPKDDTFVRPELSIFTAIEDTNVDARVARNARMVLVLIELALIELVRMVLAKMELVFSTRLFSIVVVRLLVFRNIELTLLVTRLERYV